MCYPEELVTASDQQCWTFVHAGCSCCRHVQVATITASYAAQPPAAEPLLTACPVLSLPAVVVYLCCSFATNGVSLPF
jgi:hypothetical protein